MATTCALKVREEYPGEDHPERDAYVTFGLLMSIVDSFSFAPFASSLMSDRRAKVQRMNETCFFASVEVVSRLTSAFLHPIWKGENGKRKTTFSYRQERDTFPIRQRSSFWPDPGLEQASLPISMKVVSHSLFAAFRGKVEDSHRQ